MVLKSMILNVAAAAALMTGAVFAHVQAPAKNEEIFRYRGADCDARLAERAQREGTVTVHASPTVGNMKVLPAACEKKHGIKVNVWRASSENIVRRGIEASDPAWFSMVVSDLGEARGLKIFRDIVTANGISVRKGHTLLTNLVVSG